MKKRCKAITKSGNRCKNKSVQNGLCRLHLGSNREVFLKRPIVWIALAFIAAFIGYVVNRVLDHATNNDISIKLNEIANDFDCDQERNIGGPLFKDDIVKNDTLWINYVSGIVNPQGGETTLHWGITRLPIDKSGTDDFRGCVSTFFDKEVRSCSMSVAFDELNNFLVSANIFDVNMNPIAVVEDNYIRVTNCGYFLNFDDNGMEIVDPHLNVVFSLDRISDNDLKFKGILQINGIFYLLNGTPHVLVGNDGNQSKKMDYIRSIPRLFRYTGPNWRGSRL